MSSVIFYFSGTGNSYAVAKEIALKNNSRLVSIKKMVDKKEVEISEDVIGVVFPAYYMTMPRIVNRFISKLNGIAGKYIYSVVTVAGIAGNINDAIRSALYKRGGELSAGFVIRMPGNYIDSSSALPVFLQHIILSNSKNKINRIIAKIKIRKTGYYQNINPIGTLLFSRLIKKNQILEFDISDIDSNFWTDNKCTLCGTCQKICPVGNIGISDKNVCWKGNCEKCFACIHWCVNSSIQFSNKTLRRKRYRHPDVSLSELQ